MSASGESELMVNWNIFTSAEQAIATVLVSAGQSHLFSGWPEPGNFDEDKRRLMAQAIDLDQKCPGGIEGYCTRARDLLEASRTGSNPYQGFKPSVPLGQSLETQSAEGQAEFDRLEAKGMSEMAGTAFVLVAGGLGERLGYDGIKVELPAEITTETCYLDLYCQHILALQARARVQSGDSSITLPLAIMTSGDTDTQTRALLEAHSNFGMAEGQLTVVMQELVPALLDNAAHMATSEDDPFLIETKPHGHGDVHLLLHQSGLASKWAVSGVKWVLFFQDTNGLVFRAAPAAIGVSAEKNLAVNSLTVPRKPGEAVGAICRLEGENGAEMTINVEYNQLDALMTASGMEDTCDESGFSSYPGNINVLVFDCPQYAAELQRSGGVIAEFVNPKYSDATKTRFAKPTRLECMMQDYPKNLTEGTVGCVQFERWNSFSAVKNNVEEASKKQAVTGYAESAASGEADIYYANRKLLRAAGATITVDAAEEEFEGIKVQGGAKVVLAPSFSTTMAEVRARVHGASVTISDRSTLVLEGDVRLESLDLDGTLVVRAAPGAAVVVAGLVVRNGGSTFKPISDLEREEKFAIRGYRVVKAGDVSEIFVKESGDYVLGPDGLVKVMKVAAVPPYTEAHTAAAAAADAQGDSGPAFIKPIAPSVTAAPGPGAASHAGAALLALAMWSLVNYVL